MWGVSYDNLYTMITGQTGEFDDPKEFIDKLSDNTLSSDTVAQLSCNKAMKVKDVNGKKVKLVGTHAYAISNVTKDTVTLLNPWNTGESIVLPRDTFENLDTKKCSVYSLDLNTLEN